MKKCTYISVIFALFTSTSHAQEKSITPFVSEGDLNCRYIKKFNEEERLKFYPFNISDTVKLASFRFHTNSYPFHKDYVVIDSLIEFITLTQKEVNKLTDILYNNFYKQQPNYEVFSMCFFPRNAIVFIDSKGKIREHVNICFHCDNYGRSSDEISLGDNCEQKMEKLRKLFKSVGVKFGTDRTIDEYPGENLKDEGIIPKSN